MNRTPIPRAIVRPMKTKKERTLRDYFAAKAMQGVLACSLPIKYDGKIVGVDFDLSKYCYLVADAMLEERDK